MSDTMSDTMREHQILFKGEMVRAIMDGRKCETRRVIIPQPPQDNWHPKQYSCDPKYWIGYTMDGRMRNDVGPTRDTCYWQCPYGQAGDTIWVRETIDARSVLAVYQADGTPIEQGHTMFKAKIIPSIHMPRWASRITLEVTCIKVERVQDITVPGALNEGVDTDEMADWCPSMYVMYFKKLWDSINASRGYGWDKNPWVWVVSFRRVKP